MKVIPGRPVPFLILGLAVLLALIYAFWGIPSKEGFNPSDDGVILAQSYRLLQGEVPHRDFISIRPAGSGYMHLLNFLSPLPLELSARWMTLAEYFVYSVLLVLMLMGSWLRGLRRSMYLLVAGAAILVVFVLNQNHYNLFPWTTIDALFWFSIALYSWFRLKAGAIQRRMLWQVGVMLGVTGAVLCRQTFILPGILLIVRVVWWEFSGGRSAGTGRLVKGLAAMALGALPGLLYMGMLAFTGSWPDFFQQLTGRTELWETGFIRFHDSFWQSPTAIFFVLAIVAGLVHTWAVEAGRDPYFSGLILMILKLISFGTKIVLAFLVFLKPEWLFAISHAFFWFLVLDLFLLYLHAGRLPRWTGPAVWILLVSWTSAISLGDNFPVFATGWLAGTALLLQLRDFSDRLYRKVRVTYLVAAGVLVPALLGLSVVVQLRVNYRDLPASGLTHDGGAVFPDLAGIRLSPEMYGYLSEIREWYRKLDSPKGKFAVWPNNALIYTLLQSPNPFPLDWMQQPEYAGNENRVMADVQRILEREDVFVLVEKMNVKWIAGKKMPVDPKAPEYAYMKLLDSLALPLTEESEYFRVYRSR